MREDVHTAGSLCAQTVEPDRNGGANMQRCTVMVYWRLRVAARFYRLLEDEGELGCITEVNTTA
jgi:hypothetical protein